MRTVRINKVVFLSANALVWNVDSGLRINELQETMKYTHDVHITLLLSIIYSEFAQLLQCDDCQLDLETIETHFYIGLLYDLHALKS